MEADRGGCRDPQWVPAPPHHWDPPAPPQVELSRGNNVLYWRTTAFSVWSKVPKPVLVRNIGITGRWARGGGAPAVPHPTLSTFVLPGVAYTSECFPCKPGTYAAAAGSSFCQLCPANTFSSKGATACQPCEPATYAGESRVSPSLQPRDARGCSEGCPRGDVEDIPGCPLGTSPLSPPGRARLRVLQGAAALHGQGLLLHAHSLRCQRGGTAPPPPLPWSLGSPRAVPTPSRCQLTLCPCLPRPSSCSSGQSRKSATRSCRRQPSCPPRG